MSIVFMTGDHGRHSFLARQLIATGLVSGIIVEHRESFKPSPPEGLDSHLTDLFVRHFARRDESEQRFFGSRSSGFGSVPVLRVDLEELNTPKTWDFIRRHDPKLLLSYGVHKLTDETLSQARGHRWNIHGGLSPWYRGVITHFWPSYMLEPQMTGMTVHTTTQAIDGGDIVHQSAAPLVSGDGLHDLACRAVNSLARDLPELMLRMDRNELEPARAQGTTGRIWRSKDWRPEHLRVVYDLFRDRIVDRYLAGDFAAFEPKLTRQF